MAKIVTMSTEMGRLARNEAVAATAQESGPSSTLRTHPIPMPKSAAASRGLQAMSWLATILLAVTAGGTVAMAVFVAQLVPKTKTSPPTALLASSYEACTDPCGNVMTIGTSSSLLQINEKTLLDDMNGVFHDVVDANKTQVRRIERLSIDGGVSDLSGHPEYLCVDEITYTRKLKSQFHLNIEVPTGDPCSASDLSVFFYESYAVTREVHPCKRTIVNPHRCKPCPFMTRRKNKTNSFLWSQPSTLTDAREFADKLVFVPPGSRCPRDPDTCASVTRTGAIDIEFSVEARDCPA